MQTEMFVPISYSYSMLSQTQFLSSTNVLDPDLSNSGSACSWQHHQTKERRVIYTFIVKYFKNVIT
jgi:hypothetical protein